MQVQKRFPKRFPILAGALLLSLALNHASADESKAPVLSGAGWMQYGMIFKSSDQAPGFDLNGNSIYSSGAQVSFAAPISANLDARAGIGVFLGHTIAGTVLSNGGYAPSTVSPYVAEANFTYSFWNEENSKLSLRGGLFPYDYNPDVQNLGLYLLRGPVYPGILISGFETKHVLPVADMLGLQVHQQFGSFEQDFILSSETELFPFFDLSPAYIATMHVGKGFRIGAGVNFYHLIPLDDSLTSGVWSGNKAIYVDTTGGGLDTTVIPFSGTKLMANASFDPKSLMSGSGSFGPEDLKIYGEVALIGLKNTKVYQKIFGDYVHRMPVMMGFNLPMFNLLERLSLEVEWYGAPFRDNLDGYDHIAGQRESPLPMNDGSNNFFKATRDNWKWSLYGSRVIQNHVKISFQLANDHYRPGIYSGDGDNAPPSAQAILFTPKDWYGMMKLAYFF